MEPQSSKECIEEIVRLANMLGWTFATLEPEDKKTKVEGMILGTENFCADAILIITNVLNRMEDPPCTDTTSSPTSDVDEKLSEG